MLDLKDKIVVVTGGSRGIGAACCRAFARNGAQVIFTYNTNKEKAKELADQLGKLGAQCHAYGLDVKDFAQCRTFADFVLDTFGSIDVLVNNAGIVRDKALMMMSPDDWNAVIDTNLNSVFNVTKNFIVSFMKQKHGAIINIASLGGMIGMARQVNYSASKGGMIAFTRSLAKEMAAFNVRVNAVAPGFIQTDMLEGLKEEFVQALIPQIPLQRVGTADEVAEAVIFLASKASGYITGEILRVDGGLGT